MHRATRSFISEVLAPAMVMAWGLVPGAASAQPTTAEHTNLWLVLSGNHRLSEAWGFYTEYQPRRHDGLEHGQQTIVRVAVDRYLKAGPMVSAGYAWIASYPYGQQPIDHPFNEHRIWEQFFMDHRVGRFHFQHRYRLEQRFMERKLPQPDGAWSADGFQYRNRGRYRVLFNLPLTRGEMSDNTLFLSVWDEVFGQFGSGVGANAMDQNRFYAGFGWRLDQQRNVQAGYLNQYLLKSDGVRAERNHTVQVSLTWNLDLRAR